jgi:pyridoxamine 5'-phosphate oxidase
MSDQSQHFSDRREFEHSTLDESGLQAVENDPWAFFAQWLSAAKNAGLEDYNAMVLSSLTIDGAPDARVVLIRSIDDKASTGGEPIKSLSFFTNFNSEKGRQLAADPRCSVTFYWKELERQVRMMGRAVPMSDAACDAYFSSRPRGSQLGAWASLQSEVIDGRSQLEEQLAEAAARFEGRNVARPSHWGGYAFVPHNFEFWQGRPSRLHDRIRCTQASSGAWIPERLSP